MRKRLGRRFKQSRIYNTRHYTILVKRTSLSGSDCNILERLINLLRGELFNAFRLDCISKRLGSTS